VEWTGKVLAFVGLQSTISQFPSQTECRPVHLLILFLYDALCGGGTLFRPWPERWAIGTITQRWLWRPLAMGDLGYGGPWLWGYWIEQGLTSPPTQYRLSGRQGYGGHASLLPAWHIPSRHLTPAIRLVLEGRTVGTCRLISPPECRVTHHPYFPGIAPAQPAP